MAEGNSPKGGAGVFAKKLQRQLSRSKEKVLQRLGKTVETRDEQFDHYLQKLNDQQTDGNRIYKDLKVYLNTVRDMRDASRRLSQSLFDAYETDWAAEEDLGAIVEGEDLLWNDYEVKLLDQAVRTMESYMGQFPDVRERVSKRGRKLVDYDSSRHHLEALQTAKKRDDVKIIKAEEEVNIAKSVYEYINSELKEELPVLFESRIGCYVAVFSAISNLRDTFLKEMTVLNQDLQNVIKELQGQHPDKVLVVKGWQRYGSLKRRSLMSPKSWKASFSEFHKGYSPKPGHQRLSLRSPDKPRHGTLSRESSTFAMSPQSSEFREVDADSTYSDTPSSPAEVKPNSHREDTETETTGDELKSGEDGNRGEENNDVKEEESEPEPSSDRDAVASDNKREGEKPPSESSSELNNSYDSESLELQLSAVGNSPLYIEEKEESTVALDSPKSKGLENGDVSDFDSDAKELSLPHKDVPAGNQASPDSKTTTV
ncbi:bridging integrator 2a [Diretmus argenteus]